MTHRKFPSIEQFDQIFARETYTDARRTLTYYAKAKMHGTNMGICVEPGGPVQAQSKNLIATVENDTTGFAEWLAPQMALWADLNFDEVVTFYGEWAGPGIGRGDAVQQTDKKRFYIFALGIGEAPHHQDERYMTPRLMITDPATIERHLPNGLDRDEVRVLPYEGAPFIFDFSDERAIQSTLDELNALIGRVAERCPYIYREFEIFHPGEGYVLVPHADIAFPISCEVYSRSCFKAKTDKHRVRKQGKPATAREPLPETAAQFIETFCTPQRVDQAIDEICGGHPDVTATGDVIKWMLVDIKKEANAEIEALGVPFARLKGEIASTTRAHFMARIPFREKALH
jgi:hypothetical protein